MRFVIVSTVTTFHEISDDLIDDEMSDEEIIALTEHDGATSHVETVLHKDEN